MADWNKGWIERCEPDDPDNTWWEIWLSESPELIQESDLQKILPGFDPKKDDGAKVMIERLRRIDT